MTEITTAASVGRKRAFGQPQTAHKRLSKADYRDPGPGPLVARRDEFAGSSVADLAVIDEQKPGHRVETRLFKVVFVRAFVRPLVDAWHWPRFPNHVLWTRQDHVDIDSQGASQRWLVAVGEQSGRPDRVDESVDLVLSVDDHAGRAIAQSTRPTPRLRNRPFVDKESHDRWLIVHVVSEESAGAWTGGLAGEAEAIAIGVPSSGRMLVAVNVMPVAALGAVRFTV